MRWLPLIALLGCGSQEDVLTARKLPASLAPDAAAVVAANNQFAADIYAQLPAGNAFCSPFSISTALAMLDAGAAGQTDAELRSAMHFTLPPAQLHPAYGALLDSLDVGRDYGAYTLATANRLFGQDGYPFLPSFLATTKDDYHAELEPVDFANDPEGARGKVNGWVSDQTEGKIPELFGAGTITSDTQLVLANAIVFKGNWEHQFDASLTQNGAFRRADGTTVMVPMMSKQDRPALASIPGGQLAKLPFRGKDLSMIVMVPDDPNGLPAIEAQLGSVTQWLGTAHESTEEIEVRLPRFKISSDLDLEKSLAALGMTSMFDPTSADLSGIDGEKGLFVQKTVHKAVIAVDEQGAEAAAATGIGVGDTAAPTPFIADRPFAFAIYDEVTGSILFLGRVSDPS